MKRALSLAVCGLFVIASGCKKKGGEPSHAAHHDAAAADSSEAHTGEPAQEASKDQEHAAEATKGATKDATSSPLGSREPEKETAHEHGAKEGETPAKGAKEAEADAAHAKAEPEAKPLPVLAPASTDLKDEIAKFTTIAACVTQKSNLEPMLNDALLAIGYDTIVQDTCRVIDAAKARDARRCESIEVSGVREFCQSFTAKVVGDPDLCPWVSSHKPSLGRDPFCVAIAGRDKKLCIATNNPVLCEALAMRDDLHCANLGVETERKPCEKLVERWHTVLTAGAASRLGTIVEPKGQAAIVPLDSKPALAPAPIDLSSDLAHGVVLVQQPGGYRVELAGPLEHGANFIAPAPLAHSRVAIDLVVMDETHQGKVENIEVTLAGNGSLATPAAKALLTVKVRHFDLIRSGTVDVAIEGTLTSGTRGYTVAAEYTTFVRDIVKADAALAGAKGAKRSGVR